MDLFTGIYRDDLKIMEERIGRLKFQTSTNRKKLLSVPESQGGSMLWGSTFRQHPAHYKQRKPDPDSPGKNMTKVKEEEPDLREYFIGFRDWYFPDFKFNSVHINKNYGPLPPHFDSKNCGESVLVAFGDYKGGSTCLYNEKIRKIEKHDARIQPLIFNGSEILHWVEPHFAGDRYSLVFFNSNRT